MRAPSSALVFAFACACLPLVAACPAAVDDGTEGEGEPAGEGELEGELDAGTPLDGGSDAGAGAGEGEGEIPICDGGVCEDAGVQGQEYEGEPEEGVVCGSQTCAVAVEPTCCVTADLASIEGKCIESDAVCEGGLINATFTCDGPEDCDAATQECCLHEDITTTCVPIGTCQANPDTTDSVVCLDTASGCQLGELCCGLAVQFDVPVDMGTCTNEEDNCQVQ